MLAPMTKKPFNAWISDAPEDKPPADQIIAPQHHAPIDITYSSPSDVPKPLRDTIAHAYRRGVSAKHLAESFQFPEDWIEIFARRAN